MDTIIEYLWTAWFGNRAAQFIVLALTLHCAHVK